MRILNLYSGIGGNRLLWDKKHNVVAVEFNPEIAAIYKEKFPNDNVVVGDAHEYLLKNYKEFDFIWTSPPCQTHTRILFSSQNKRYESKKMCYPDMKLYQEIILLKNFCNCKWVVENVISYYEPLISPNAKLLRHFFWSNFYICEKDFKDKSEKIQNVSVGKPRYTFNLKGEKIKNKRQILRNLVNPELGKHILNCAENII